MNTQSRSALGIIMLAIGLILIPSLLLACTTFCLKTEDGVIFGRNYDWHIGDGFVVVNKRNMAKKTVSQDNDKSLEWTSKYGSISFNQYGVDSPMDGINEAGLVVAQMWLDGTKYPQTDSRPGVGALTWIQYHLDNSSNIEEVINGDKKLRIDQSVAAPLHFLVCDKSGQAAVIEFLGGKMVVHWDNQLPYAALANSTYEKSLRYLEDKKDSSIKSFVRSWTSNSLNRFAIAAEMVSQYRDKMSGDPIEYGFEILNAVASSSRTQWSIVYGLTKLEVSFKTLQISDRKKLVLADFQLECSTPIQLMDINSDHSENLAGRFEPYTKAANLNLVKTSYRKTPFLSRISDSAINSIAAYPDSFRCTK